MTTSRIPAGSFLAPSPTANYQRSAVGSGMGSATVTGNWVPWSLMMVETMRPDPQIQFGLGIIMAPLYTVTWEVESESSEVRDYVDDTLHRVWKGLSKWQTLIEYGYMPGEPQWHEEDGCIRFRELKDFYPYDAKPLQIGGQLAGIEVKSPPQAARLGVPRALWAANQSRWGSFYGYSRLYGAYLPFMEKSGRHGATDVRRSWGIRCAFDGGVLYYPIGQTAMEDGSTRNNEDIAREILEKKESGGVILLPNTMDDSGNFMWKYEPPKINGSFAELREWPKDLDSEILRGMNIPPEVVTAAESGSGWSGRSVPFLVFLTSEDQIADTILHTVDRQIIRPGVEVNFGRQKYKVRLNPLAKLAEAPPAPTGNVPATKDTTNAAQTPPKATVAVQPKQPANLSQDVVPEEVPATFYSKLRRSMRRWLGKTKVG